MFFRVQELELHKIQFDRAFAPGEIDFEDTGLEQRGSLKTQGVAELPNAALEEIRVKGHVVVEMQGHCDRCLEPIALPLDHDFELCYQPLSAAPEGEEIAISEDDTELGFYEGDGLELKEVLREQILLWLPMQRVCQEACQGICPECGQNRNQAICACQPRLRDDRWTALQSLNTKRVN